MPNIPEIYVPLIKQVYIFIYIYIIFYYLINIVGKPWNLFKY